MAGRPSQIYTNHASDSNMDSTNDHFFACWRHQSCYNCIHETRSCGWCPYTSTCVPIPSRMSLLSPVSNAHVCPLRDERFELRTKALGCECSTTTLLSIVVTVLATIAAMGLLYGLGRVVWWVNGTFGSGTWRGVEVEIVKGDGVRVVQQWRRRGGWGSNIAASFQGEQLHSDRSEQEQVTERSRLMG